LGCQLGNKRGLETIRRIRKLDDKHNFTLVCRDLSELGNYAKVDNSAYRLLKNHTPGPYTFILKATSEVPKRLMHPKRRTIGLRVPNNNIALALLAGLDEPLMSVTMMLPGDDVPMTDPYEIRQVLEHELDLVIDGGYCGMEATSVIDWVDDVPVVVRQGQGDTSLFEVD
jgi:tRNA threonylcarbamoyl adenosine modification protein (Sua5/YciO/YrdC/YwlC family)